MVWEDLLGRQKIFSVPHERPPYWKTLIRTTKKIRRVDFLAVSQAKLKKHPRAQEGINMNLPGPMEGRHKSHLGR